MDGIWNNNKNDTRIVVVVTIALFLVLCILFLQFLEQLCKVDLYYSHSTDENVRLREVHKASQPRSSSQDSNLTRSSCS